LVDGEYQPIPLTTEPDGVLKGYSAVLELSLCWIEERNWMRFYDPATGSYLSTLLEMHAALEYERSALEAERDAREADQQRIRELEEQLRRLKLSQ
jgi:hypothetical protein